MEINLDYTNQKSLILFKSANLLDFTYNQLAYAKPIIKIQYKSSLPIYISPCFKAGSNSPRIYAFSTFLGVHDIFSQKIILFRNVFRDKNKNKI